MHKRSLEQLMAIRDRLGNWAQPPKTAIAKSIYEKVCMEIGRRLAG